MTQRPGFVGLVGCWVGLAGIPWSSSAVDGPSLKPAAQMGEFLDIGHAAVSRGLGEAADYIDEFFVDERVDEEYNQSRLRVRLGARGAEGGRSRVKANLSLNLALPEIEEGLSLIVRSLTDDEDSELDPAGLRDGDRDVVGGLRFFLLDRGGFKVNVDGGFKFRPEPVPLVRVRGRYQFQVGEYLLRPTQQVFWRSDDGFGEITRLDVDRALGSKYLGRVRTEVEWAEDISGVEIRPSVLLYRVLGERAGVRFRIAGALETEPSAVFRAYEASLRFRWSFFRPWLYFEVEPGLLLERDRDYELSPEVTGRVEVLIGPQYVEELIE